MRAGNSNQHCACVPGLQAPDLCGRGHLVDRRLETAALHLSDGNVTVGRICVIAREGDVQRGDGKEECQVSAAYTMKELLFILTLVISA